jgi:hypothetical protein
LLAMARRCPRALRESSRREMSSLPARMPY